MSDGGLLVEACVDSVASALAAERAGAQRLELCDNLAEDGTTPSAGMIAAVKARVSIPVFVMVRPRGGSFVYSDEERDVMRRDVDAALRLGADGIVTGALREDATVDLETTRALVECARGAPVTFHRAFDAVANQADALEVLAEAGVARVLTSGGAATAIEGAERIGSLVRQARERLVVMAGGGIIEQHVAELVGQSGVGEIHLRGTRLQPGHRFGAIKRAARA